MLRSVLKLAPVLAAIACPHPATGAQSVADSAWASTIEAARRLLQEHRSVTNVPGVQVAIRVGGRLIWSEGLGWADVENGAPVTPLTRFPIGSVSKSITAVAAARLADRGMLDMDAEVSRYLTGAAAALPAGVTVRRLGQHLAGVRHYHRDEAPGFERHYETAADALGLFIGDSLVATPGERYAYSSYGYVLLSAALEGAADRPFLEILNREVFEPLEMTGSMGDLRDRVVPYRTVGYVAGPHGRSPAIVEDPSYKWAGGGLLSTAEDLTRLGSALLDPGFVTEQALELLFAPGRTAEGEPTYYSFGWEVWQRGDLIVRSHGGQLDYGRAHLVILPESRVVVAYLANTGQGIGFNQGEAAWLAELFAVGTRAGSTTTPDPTDWGGHYAFTAIDSQGRRPGSLHLIEDRGVLRGHLTIGGRTEPIPVAREEDGALVLFSVPGSWRKIRLQRTPDSWSGGWEFAGLPSGRLWETGEFENIRRDPP